MLAKADLAYIYGRGESLILAEDFHYKLIRIGVNSSLESQNGFQEAKCLIPNNNINQIALVISHYCNSRQVHYVIDELMSSKIPFILITAADNPWPYDKLAAVTLRISCSESRFKLGSFASRVAMLYLLDCLYGQIFSLNYEKTKITSLAFPNEKSSEVISIMVTKKPISNLKSYRKPDIPASRREVIYNSSPLEAITFLNQSNESFFILFIVPWPSLSRST